MGLVLQGDLEWLSPYLSLLPEKGVDKTLLISRLRTSSTFF